MAPTGPERPASFVYEPSAAATGPAAMTIADWRRVRPRSRRRRRKGQR